MGCSFVPLNKSNCTDYCSLHAFSLITYNSNHICMNMSHIQMGPNRGLLFSLTWPGENSARRRVCLPSHRLVGELSHPIELLLHLVISALTPTGGNIPHDFSQYNAPCSTAVQNKIQAFIFYFPHCKLPALKTYSTITISFLKFPN